MTRHRRLSALSAVFVSLALVAAACGGDDSDSDNTTATTQGGGGSDSTAPDGTESPDTTGGDEGEGDVPTGGTLTIGMEQEGECMDWISSCAGTSWTYWAVGSQTMPRAFNAVKDGEDWVYEHSILLTGEPELVTEPKQVVTYEINPDAVWSDGTPITSADFRYTWDAIKNGSDIYDPTGYVNIESVDDSDPAKAVVTFETPYADWKQLFGGGFGLYPSHLLEGKDHLTEMRDGYSWSGGPWMLESWNKGVDMTIVPNPNYWGELPKLDRVVFRLIPDTAAEFQAYQAGEVDAIYPQPQIDVVEAINAGIQGQAEYTPETGNFEGLWINNSVAPLDSVVFRQAFAYSLDRGRIVEALFGGLGLSEPLNVMNAPILSFYTDTEAFAGYTRDLDKVEELMTGDGWAKNGSGIWAKDGQTATFTLTTTAGNARRLLTQQVVQEQAKEAGFDVQLATLPAGDFFGTSLPAGDFQMGLYAQVLTSLSPGTCNLWCSKNIPSEANNNTGQNWTRTNVPEVDPLLETLDASLDEDERAEAGKAADKILAENVVSLPLDPLPNILIWSDRVVGPVSDNPIHGPWWNLNQLGIS